MAVTVTDNRTILYQDGITNITGADTDDTSFFAESTGSAAWAINISTGQIYFSGTIPNFTTAGNELIYVWSAVVATLNGYKEATVADSSHAMYFTDGTNQTIAYMAGNDREVFKHFDGQVGFQCFMFDADYLSTAATNGDVGAIAGTPSSTDFTSLTGVGAHYTTLSKALGGGNNCYMDIIRYGGADDGITISGGTTGARGTFLEVCVEDRSTSDGKAHGIIREYTGGAYGVQGTLKVGDAGTADSFFEDSGFAVTFEDRLVSDDKFKFITQGNSTSSSNVIVLSNGTFQSARPGVTMDFSDTNVDTLTISGITFLNLLNAITFGDSTGTETHSVNNCTFNNVGQIDIGTLDSFTGNTISSTNATASTQGSIYIDNATVDDNCADLTFNSYTSKYAVYITADVPAGTTLIFDNWQFDDSGTDVYWAGTSGTLTISKTNGSNPNSSATGGGTINFVGAAVTPSVNTVTPDGTSVDGVQVYLAVKDGTGPFPYQESVTISRSGTTATVSHTGHGLAAGDKVKIRGITDKTEDNAIQTIVTATTDSYTYTTTDSGSTSYTGTITSTFVLISGSTSSGSISGASKVYSIDQPVTGYARKSSSSPYYKSFTLNGTVDDVNGLTITAVMISDE